MLRNMARPISPLTKFILSLPRETSVGDVIAKAKDKGLKTSAGNVHQVRSKYELQGGSVVKKGGAPRKAPKAAKKAAPKAAPAAKAAPKAAPPAVKRGPGRPPKAASAPAAAGKSNDAEKALKEAAIAVVLAHGIVRAQAVVDGVISRIRAAGNALGRHSRGTALAFTGGRVGGTGSEVRRDGHEPSRLTDPERPPAR